MDVAIYTRAIRIFWPIPVALALACGGALGLAAHRHGPVYRAQAHLLVSFLLDGQVAVGSDEPAAKTDLAKQRRVKTYAGMLNDRRLTEPVIRSLHLRYTPEELRGHIVASSPLNTFAIDLAVTDGSADVAAAIANGLVSELAMVARGDKPSTELPARTTVWVLSAASPPRRPVPVRWQLHVVAGALAGFAVGLGLGVLLEHAREGRSAGVDLRDAWSSAIARWRSRQRGNL